MAIMDTIKAWTQGVTKDLIAEYEKAGRRASGNWEKDLDGEITKTSVGYRVTFWAAFYTEYMEKGRRRNKRQSWEYIRAFAAYMANSTNGPIYRWCKDKGVSTAAAFPIAVKLAREGYEGRPFISKVLNDERINQLIEDVGLFMVQEFKSDFTHIMQTA